MSTDREGGPPPPSQTPPNGNANGFDRLPAELLLLIVDHLNEIQFAALALAVYPSLQRHRLVPPLTVDMLFAILFRNQRWIPRNPQNRANAKSLPLELWFQVASYLEPSDAFVVLYAGSPMFPQYEPNVTTETMVRLIGWSRRLRRGP